MLEHLGVSASSWRDAGKNNKNFLESESPLFVGRAVAALAADSNVLKRSGQLCSSWELACEYKFTDEDGRRPDWGAIDIDFSQHPPAFLEYYRTSSQIQLEWLEALSRRTKRFMAQLPLPKGHRPARLARKRR
jgi:hypothetical protein